MSGVAQKAVMNPSISGWRTKRYSKRVWKCGSGALSPRSRVHTWARPKSWAWLIMKVPNSTVAQPAAPHARTMARRMLAPSFP